jgi:hypothetical protein
MIVKKKPGAAAGKYGVLQLNYRSTIIIKI